MLFQGCNIKFFHIIPFVNSINICTKVKLLRQAFTRINILFHDQHVEIDYYAILATIVI